MPHKLQTISEIIAILRSGTNIGDVAVLKLTLLDSRETPNQYSAAAMALKHISFGPITLDFLRQLPSDSFGRAYFEFMERNKLQPFNFSQRVESLYDLYPVSARYARVHDMIHTLLGFEADLEGELGVYAFVNRQAYSHILTRAYKTARIVARLLKPPAWRAFAQAEARGSLLADGAKILVVERLEDHLHKPLAEVRHDLVLGYAKENGHTF